MKSGQRYDDKMIPTQISLNDTISNIKKLADSTLLNPLEFDEMKMSKIINNIQENNMMCIPFESDHYILKILTFVREKSKDWKMQLSDDFIIKELEEFVYHLKIDQKKYEVIGKSVKNWLENMKKSPVTNFCFILPVNNVNYCMDLDFGKIKLKKLTLTDLEKLASFESVGFYSAGKTMKSLISCNKTKTFAIINIQAKDVEQGMILANLNLKRLIHAVRLFDPSSNITEREYFFPNTVFYYMTINMDDGSSSSTTQRFHLNTHISQSNEYWESIQPYWNDLKLFLFSQNLNQMQSLILTAMYWYGDARKETESEISKFLKYIYGLESLVIFDTKYDKKDRMAKRLATIFSKKNSSSVDSTFYDNLFRRYYAKRNSIVHAGELNVNPEGRWCIR